MQVIYVLVLHCFQCLDKELKRGAEPMSKIYHIKPKDNRKKQKEPLWKYILVIAIVIFILMLRDHRIDLSGLYNFILSTKGILNR